MRSYEHMRTVYTNNMTSGEILSILKSILCEHSEYIVEAQSHDKNERYEVNNDILKFHKILERVVDIYLDIVF